MTEIKHCKGENSEADEFLKKVWREYDDECFGREMPFKKEKHVFLAKEGNTPIRGVLSMNVRSGVMYISSLIVSKDWRRKGIGTKLMNECETWAKEHSVHKAYLYTENVTGGAGFYRKMGFEELGTLPNFYNKMDFTIFSKDLEV